jgi:hypothetical protein
LAIWFDGPGRIALNEEIIGLGKCRYTLTVLTSEALPEDPSTRRIRNWSETGQPASLMAGSHIRRQAGRWGYAASRGICPWTNRRNRMLQGRDLNLAIEQTGARDLAQTGLPTGYKDVAERFRLLAGLKRELGSCGRSPCRRGKRLRFARLTRGTASRHLRGIIRRPTGASSSL